MFTCPHCQYPLLGKFKKEASNGTVEVMIQCTHCTAVLRVSITTLRDPEPEKLSRINTVSPPSIPTE